MGVKKRGSGGAVGEGEVRPTRPVAASQFSVEPGIDPVQIGVGALDPARNGDPDQVIDAFDAKAMVFLRVANAVIPGMREAGYGRIVVLSGQNAFVTGSITGSVRNAATILVAKNLADSLAGTGVTVNAVSPGIVSETPETEVQPGSSGQSSPQQIADLIAFLSSPLSAVSGESIAIGHRVRGVTLL